MYNYCQPNVSLCSQLDSFETKSNKVLNIIKKISADSIFLKQLFSVHFGSMSIGYLVDLV